MKLELNKWAAAMPANTRTMNDDAGSPTAAALLVHSVFAEQVIINKPGRQIDPAEISATLATPARRVVQPDGRVRHWRWVATRGHWLRVVTEADGATSHNAFWDRSFRP